MKRFVADAVAWSALAAGGWLCVWLACSLSPAWYVVLGLAGWMHMTVAGARHKHHRAEFERAVDEAVELAAWARKRWGANR